MSRLRRIASTAATLLSGDAIARVLLFLTTAYAARVLGPAPFGTVAFAQALLGYVTLASDWGLSTYGIREVAHHPERGRDAWLALTTVRVSVAMVLAAIGAAVVAVAPLEPAARWVVILTLLSAVPAAAIPDWVARGLSRMRLAAALGVLQPALALALILLWVRAPAAMTGVPGARLLAAVVTAVAGCALIARPWRGTRAEPRAWVRDQGPSRLFQAGGVLLLANAAVLAYNSADQLLLGVLRGAREVGLYGSAYRLIQLPMAALYAVTAASLPVLARLWREQPAEARAITHRLTALAAGAGVAIAAGMWLLREPLVRMVYGPAYGEAARALGVLAFVVPLDFMVSVKGTSYIAAGRERGTLVCVALAAAVNIAANLIGIPRFGMMAAAWTTLASYAVLLLAYALVMDTRRA